MHFQNFMNYLTDKDNRKKIKNCLRLVNATSVSKRTDVFLLPVQNKPRV